MEDDFWVEDRANYWFHVCKAERDGVLTQKDEPCNWCGEYQNGTTFPDRKKKD